MDTKHTPGDLAVFIGNANGRGLVRIETAIGSPAGGGLHVASLTRDREEDALRIVRCWNSHDDLVSALTALYDRRTDHSMAKAREALDKARGLR